MNHRFLVVVHAGDSSRHTGWLAGSAPRNWDLLVCYGGTDPHRYTTPADGVARVVRPGPKWQALAALLHETQAAWSAYDHVFLPTDDIEATADDFNRLFEIVSALQLPLAQPSFSRESAAACPLSLHNSAFGVRYASFVDAAAPVFSSALLQRALPSLDGAADERSLGQRWPRLLDDAARQCAIVDAVQVHRRGALPPDARGSMAPVQLCYGGFDREGRLHHLFDPASDAFVPRLADGYAGLPALPGIVADHEAARREIVATAPPASVPDVPAESSFALTVGTSLAPQGETKQRRAVESWQALGFEVVSFNNRAEILALQPRYPGVRFVEVTRDGRERTGKPLVHVDDVFAWFRASGLPYGGFVNSDVVLQPADGAGFIASIRANIDGAMLFSRRVEVQTLERLEGSFYPTGFDVWFWDSRVLASFEQPTDYFVGFPHWDYYALLMPLVHGFALRQFTFPFAYHETHRMYYDVVRDGIPYALKTFERLAGHVDRIPLQNHLFQPLIDFFVARRPQAIQNADDIAYYHAFLHALDLWFLDVIDRNSEKIRAADGGAAQRDAGVPFLGAPALAALPQVPTTPVAPVAPVTPAAPTTAVPTVAAAASFTAGPPPAAAEPLAAAAPQRAAAPSRSFRLRGDASAAAGLPALSIIIPTFNRAAILERCLAHLAVQTLAADRYEIVIVDDGSSDGTQQIIEAAARTRTIVHERQANLGPAAARNRALKRARGEWVMFLNDDALLDPRALEIHLEEHARRGPRAAVLGAFSMHPDYVRSDRPLGHCLDRSDLVFEYARMVPDRAYDHAHFYTCNISLARDFVLRHGGFDEGFVRMGAEDIELGMRLQADGCQVFYRPDCIARHAHMLDAPGLARMFQFRGRGGVHLFVRNLQRDPHYATMPPQRIGELQALDARLKPLLQKLEAAIARFDTLPCISTGAAAALDERASGIDLRWMWQWADNQIEQLVEALIRNVEHHATLFAAEKQPSLEAAAGRLYPALQFVKWWNDTLGVLSSGELRGYLASRQQHVARLAA